DPGLESIIERSLAKDKSQRYETCEEMAADLTRFLDRLDSLEQTLSASVSSGGGLSETIETIATDSPATLEAVRFRPLNRRTDYAVNLERYKNLDQITPASTELSKPPASRRWLILAVA